MVIDHQVPVVVQLVDGGRGTVGVRVDEIGLAVGLGRTRVDELLRDECLPRARQACRRMGLAPAGTCGGQVEST